MSETVRRTLVATAAGAAAARAGATRHGLERDLFSSGYLQVSWASTTLQSGSVRHCSEEVTEAVASDGFSYSILVAK